MNAHRSLPPGAIDLARSADRIDADVQALAEPPYSASPECVCRYAYTDPFLRTRDYFARAWEDLGFSVRQDPVGNFVARNCPPGEPAFGVGSHFDSNRNGGRWDGTLGVAIALELCRLDRELGLELPLQAIAFLEEEGSGFGELLLGSRIVAGQVDDRDLRERIRALDDGRSFAEHATEAGHEPERWRECATILDGLGCWIEVHIEQGRLLQDARRPIGLVHAIAGYVHGDIVIDGRADHAGATPMNARLDSAVVAGLTIAELERAAREMAGGIVATVGEIEVAPGLINVVPGRTRLSLDVRGPDQAAISELVALIGAFAERCAEQRGMRAAYRERRSVAPVALADDVLAALADAARACGHDPLRMVSGAAHDTMLVAPRVPSAMLFVPCRDGLSHTPLEHADPRDAARATEVILTALLARRQAGMSGSSA